MKKEIKTSGERVLHLEAKLEKECIHGAGAEKIEGKSAKSGS